MTVDVRSQFWFGPTTTSSAPDDAGDGKWVAVHVGFSGRTTLTNEGATAEAAAGSVLFEYNAGWAATSPVCRLLEADDGPASVRGGYCWRRLGSASLLDPLRLLHRLQPGEQRTMMIAPDPAPAGLTTNVLAAQVRPIGRALALPDVLVVTTSDALRDDTQADALRGVCAEEQVGPIVGAGGGSAQPLPPSVHAIVATTTPLKCTQLPPLSE